MIFIDVFSGKLGKLRLNLNSHDFTLCLFSISQHERYHAAACPEFDHPVFFSYTGKACQQDRVY